jgi:hypothetical protein
MISKQMFLDRVHPNILAQALKQVNLNLSKDSNGKPEDWEECKYVVESDEYPGSVQSTNIQDPHPEAELDNWHMSGLQTVVLHNNRQTLHHEEDEITPIKPATEAMRGESQYEYSESEDGCSEVGEEDLVEYEGCTPLSETSDEELIEIPIPKQFFGDDESNSEQVQIGDPGGADMFLDNNENTVIELDNFQRANCEDKPITPGVDRNRSFQELIEDKIPEEDRSSRKLYRRHL